jgi:superfamily II DNA or RNA helicase
MVTAIPSLIGPQEFHVQTLINSLNSNGFAIDASDTGTGKTFCAVSVAHRLKRPTVIICPKSVIPSWQKVLNSFNIKPKALINYEKIGRGNQRKLMVWKKMIDPSQVPCENPKKVELPLFKFSKNTLVILDEGHRCKGNGTTNSQMLISLTSQGYTVLVASATIACSPLEMKAIGYLTKLHQLHDFKNFCLVHGAGWLGKFGTMMWDSGSNEAKKAMSLINHYLFNEKQCASRMRREDFGNLFPESHIIPEAFDLGDAATKGIQTVYETMEFELAKLEEKCENYSEHVFAVIMRARREAEMLKVPLFVEQIEDLFDEGKSVAVFVNFTDTIYAINRRLNKMKKFKGLIGYVIGGQNAKDRQRDIDDFQEDRKRVILANIAAGGVGISLHDIRGQYARAAVISPTWSHINFQQCLGRIWRAGGMSVSLQRIIYAAKCIEETICRKVQDKLSCLNALHDGDLSESVVWISSGANELNFQN